MASVPTSTLRDRLLNEVHTGGAAYVRNLSAAETAVQQGQFNVAKILRAIGHVQRVLALNAARMLQPEIQATPMFQQILDELDGAAPSTSQQAWTGAEIADNAQNEEILARAEIVRSRARAMLQRAVQSLTEHPDVLERDVNIFVRVCFGCGNLVEGERPAACDLCGAPGADFESFGPYYLKTHEHLGAIGPEEIVAILAATPAELRAAVAGLEENALERRPSVDEWSIKEIIAHFIETDRLFLDMSNAFAPTFSPANYSKMWVFPWETHLGKGYETMPIEELLSRFEEMRRTVLEMLSSLSVPEDWTRLSLRHDVVISFLDMGRWLANHDPGHMAHIRRQAGRENAPV